MKDIEEIKEELEQNKYIKQKVTKKKRKLKRETSADAIVSSARTTVKKETARQV